MRHSELAAVKKLEKEKYQKEEGVNIQKSRPKNLAFPHFSQETKRKNEGRRQMGGNVVTPSHTSFIYQSVIVFGIKKP